MKWVVKALNSNWVVGCGMAIFPESYLISMHDLSLNLQGTSQILVTMDTVDLGFFLHIFPETFTRRQEKLKEQFFSSHLSGKPAHSC